MDVHAFLLAFKLLYEEIKFGGLFVRLFAGNNECKQRFRQYTNLIYISIVTTKTVCNSLASWYIYILLIFSC